MKQHMHNKYQMLKNINALSIRDSALNTTDIVAELKHKQVDILENAGKRFKNELTEVVNLAIMDLDKVKRNCLQAITKSRLIIKQRSTINDLPSLPTFRCRAFHSLCSVQLSLNVIAN